MLTGLLLIGFLAAAAAALLIYADAHFGADADAVTERVNALLPQIQCGQCGYPGCRPYAAAIVRGDAAINQCAPGGDATITALARLLDRPATSLDPAFGEIRPLRIARIDEDACVGCARCLDACPVDAILGAPRFMHTVIADECTGCELCVAPCPVDCIHLVAPRVAGG